MFRLKHNLERSKRLIKLYWLFKTRLTPRSIRYTPALTKRVMIAAINTSFHHCLQLCCNYNYYWLEILGQNSELTKTQKDSQRRRWHTIGGHCDFKCRRRWAISCSPTCWVLLHRNIKSTYCVWRLAGVRMVGAVQRAVVVFLWRKTGPWEKMEKGKNEKKKH